MPDTVGIVRYASSRLANVRQAWTASFAALTHERIVWEPERSHSRAVAWRVRNMVKVSWETVVPARPDGLMAKTSFAISAHRPRAASHSRRC
jgi:hypothetical protein